MPLHYAQDHNGAMVRCLASEDTETLDDIVHGTQAEIEGKQVQCCSFSDDSISRQSIRIAGLRTAKD